MNKRLAYMDDRIDRMKARRLRDAVRGCVGCAFGVDYRRLQEPKSDDEIRGFTALVRVLLALTDGSAGEIAALLEVPEGRVTLAAELHKTLWRKPHPAYRKALMRTMAAVTALVPDRPRKEGLRPCAIFVNEAG